MISSCRVVQRYYPHPTTGAVAPCLIPTKVILTFLPTQQKGSALEYMITTSGRRRCWNWVLPHGLRWSILESYWRTKALNLWWAWVNLHYRRTLNWTRWRSKALKLWWHRNRLRSEAFRPGRLLKCWSWPKDITTWSGWCTRPGWLLCSEWVESVENSNKTREKALAICRWTKENNQYNRKAQPHLKARELRGIRDRDLLTLRRSASGLLEPLLDAWRDSVRA